MNESELPMLAYLQRHRRLFIRRHEVMVHIGIHDFELNEPQRIWIDVDIYVPLAHTQPQADRIDEVVDYDFIRQVVAERIGRGHIALQETLCDDLARTILAHPGVQAVRLSTCKPDVYPDCELVGVEVFLMKPDTPRPPAITGKQILALTGLRFNANLGILDHEKISPQPIQVDAELNQGTQPLSPHDDDISHVLDYRKVRQIIIDECTAEHVNLLESLIGKLANRLMHLPGVIGVRVRITKLEIFDDCEVAIRIESGQW